MSCNIVRLGDLKRGAIFVHEHRTYEKLGDIGSDTVRFVNRQVVVRVSDTMGVDFLDADIEVEAHCG